MAKKVLKKKMQRGGTMVSIPEEMRIMRGGKAYKKRDEELFDLELPEGTILEDFGARRKLRVAKNKNTSIMKKGGMIKRADGSYSKRGLWDNIRANKGSGKKPTAQMLKQEKKIKAQSKKK